MRETVELRKANSDFPLMFVDPIYIKTLQPTLYKQKGCLFGLDFVGYIFII